MKRLFVYIILTVSGYWILFAVIALCAPSEGVIFKREIILRAGVQLFPGFATFMAVCVSLFGRTLVKRFKRPCLSLDIKCDDVHCTLDDNDDSMATDTIARKLRVYVSVKNVSEVEASDVQLVCNRAFISKDGERFVQYCTFRAASFRWLYSPDDARFITTLRRPVEKYAKVFEVIERKEESGGDGKLGEKLEDAKKKIITSISLAVCLSTKKSPTQNKSVRYMEIPPEYRAILLPICLASSATDPKTYYVKIYWKAGNLDSFPTKERLELRCLSPEEAQSAVEVKLD